LRSLRIGMPRAPGRHRQRWTGDAHQRCGSAHPILALARSGHRAQGDM